MHIGIVTNIASPYQIDLFAEINRRIGSVSVLFLTKSEGNRQWPPLQNASFGFSYVEPTMKVPGGYLNPTLPRAMRSESCDLWILGGSYTYPSSWLARRYAEKASLPWVFWGERPSSVPLPWAKRLYLSRFLATASGVWGISRTACQVYSEAAPSGVTCERIPYAVPAPAPEFSRSSIDGEEGLVRLAVVGQLISRKNVSQAILAVSKLQERGVRAHLDVIGGGPLKGKLEELARTTGANVSFSGPLSREEVLARMARIHVLLFPTLEDGWGLVVMEALRAGTPVIGSRYSDAMLEANSIDSDVAVCIEPTADIMASAVVRLVGDDRSLGAHDLARRSRLVAAHYSTAAVAERAANSLRGIL